MIHYLHLSVQLYQSLFEGLGLFPICQMAEVLQAPFSHCHIRVRYHPQQVYHISSMHFPLFDTVHHKRKQFVTVPSYPFRNAILLITTIINFQRWIVSLSIVFVTSIISLCSTIPLRLLFLSVCPLYSLLEHIKGEFNNDWSRCRITST